MAHRDSKRKKEYDAEYRRTHPGAARAWYLANPDRARGYQCKNHNISLEQYNTLLQEQGGVCAICGEPETLKRNGKLFSLAIDHDHNCCPSTRKSCGNCIRGLLCHNCNRGLGLFKENTAWFGQAVMYINKPKRAGMVL